ncbi:MAG TPA: GNAT family N-acetyltransferase [Rhizomicrobium sp.]|nr:GNAT family N-acetyltransferase [Rhizomicrobium sp.]
MNRIEPRHDFSPAEGGWVEERLYEFNQKATGRSDGEGLAFVIRGDAGTMIGVAAGYSWAGISELRQMWVDEKFRGRGYARALLDAFIDEARKRGVKRIFVASYDFQAPAMYEKFGFRRIAEFAGWPEGHTNVLLCREFGASSDA